MSNKQLVSLPKTKEFRDFEHPNADVEQTEAILAAKIICMLGDAELSTRQAEAATGVNNSKFARIRQVKPDRFTIDRLSRF